MRIHSRPVALLACLMCMTAAPFATASSITTLFASNNENQAGGALFFDLTVGSNDLLITGFDINTDSTDSGLDFSVYTTPGTYVGNTGNAGVWTLAANGTYTGAGTNNPSSVALNSSFLLQSGLTYGFALFNGAAADRYTTAASVYSNGDLTLTLGAATNGGFDAITFSPRTWNGTIYYEVQPVPEPATLLLLGTGLGAVAARRRLKKGNT